MNKKTKIMIIVAVVLVVFIAALLYQTLRKRSIERANDERQQASQQAPAGQAVSGQGAVAPSVFPLSEGSGIGARAGAQAEVRTLQQSLNRLLGAKLAVDGKWGSLTSTAVTTYRQRKDSVLTDSTVSKAQLQAISQQAAAKPSAVVQTTTTVWQTLFDISPVGIIYNLINS